MDLRLSLEPLQILKWVGLVFAAGFIGYFGRHLSMLIIERLRKRKAGIPATTEAVREVTPGESSNADADKLKLGKKMLKLEKKRAKKTGTPD